MCVSVQSNGCGCTADGKGTNKDQNKVVQQSGFVFFGLSFLTSLILVGCASQAPKNTNMESLKKNQEFDQAVKIVIPEESEVKATIQPAVVSGSQMATPTTLPRPVVKVEKKKKKEKAAKGNTAAGEVVTVPARQPDIEDSEGFDGRRPIRDPFRVGEKVVHAVKYFKMSAGNLTLETKQYAQVNGKKNYQFRTSIKTSSLFASFYSVDDFVDVLMDFEQMIPSVFKLQVVETAVLKQAQMFFDHEKNRAIFWEKKVTEKNGEETKKQDWEIMPYSQNVFSSAFYMRTFQWEVGKENAFRVANDEQNLVFRAKALRKEKIQTEAGEFNAIVIKPEIELKGKFTPVGDIFIWLSDDDRKFILKIESKIKIGTLVSEIVELVPGI